MDSHSKRDAGDVEADERQWWECFVKSAGGALLHHIWVGSRCEMRETQEIFRFLGMDTLAGPYTGIATFCSDEWNISYCSGCHTGNDCRKCAILNIDGTGWLAYPEHTVAVEFGDGTGFMFDPKVPHCCTPSPTNRRRQGFGLYCKEAIAARGRSKCKLPAGSVVHWPMLVDPD